MIISCYTKRVYYNKKSYKIGSLIQSDIIGMIPKKGQRGRPKKNMLAKNCNVRRKENRNKEEGGQVEKL